MRSLVFVCALGPAACVDGAHGWSDVETVDTADRVVFAMSSDGSALLVSLADALRVARFTVDDGWSAAMALPVAGFEVAPPSMSRVSLSMNGSGQAMLAWSQWALEGETARGPLQLWSARFEPEDGWLESAPLYTEDSQLAPHRSRALAQLLDDGGAVVAFDAADAVWVRRVSAGGAWDDPEMVAPAGAVPGLAFGQDGATVAWSQVDRDITSVQTSRHVGGGGWAMAEAVPGAGSAPAGGLLGPSLATSADGSALLLWSRDDGAWLNRRDPAGDWSEAMMLGESAGQGVVRVNQTGSAVVAWSGATEQARLRTFDPAQGWSESHVLGRGSTALATILHDGTVIAAWSHYDRSGVWAAVRAPTGAWSDRVRLDGDDAFLIGLRADRAGNVIAVWKAGNSIRASRRAP